MVQPPHDVPAFAELLAGVSAILAVDYLDDDDLRGFRDWPANVRAAFRAGEFADGLGGLVAELFDDDEMRRMSAGAGSVEMAGILGRATITYVGELTDPAREQSLLACELELDNGESVSVIVFGEYLGGFVLRDLHLIPGRVESIVADAKRDGIVERDDRSPVDVKALALRCLEWARRTIPPPMTESWPDQLLAVEWVLRQIPGAMPDEPDWEPALMGDARDAFIDAFVESPEGRAVDLGDDRLAEAVESILWLKLGFGNNDPHLWGPIQVEYVLTDLVLRKFADVRDARDVVTTLPALIRWSHRTMLVSEAFTAEVLSAADALSEHARMSLAESRRTPGPNELLSALLRGDAASLGAIDEGPSATHWWNCQLVGGPEALANLDAIPLPADEPVDLSAVPPQVVDRVAEIGELVVGAVGALFPDDRELATAAARTVTFFGTELGDVLERGKAESAAAAVLLIVLTANGRGWKVTKKAMADAVGAKPSGFVDRARTLCNGVGLRFSDYQTALGDARLLTSETRQAILDDEDADGAG